MSSLPLMGLSGGLCRLSGQGILAAKTTDYCPFIDCDVYSSGNVLFKMGGRGGSLIVTSVFSSGRCGGSGVTVLNASKSKGAFAVRAVTLHVQHGKVRMFVVTPLGNRRFCQTTEGMKKAFVRVSPTDRGYVGIVRVQGMSGSIGRLLSNPALSTSTLTDGVRHLRIFFSLLVPSVDRRRGRLLSRTLVGACTEGKVARGGRSLVSPGRPSRCGTVPVLKSMCSILVRARSAGQLTRVLGHLIRNSTSSFGRRAGMSLAGGCAILSVSRLANSDSLLAMKVFITLSCM